MPAADVRWPTPLTRQNPWYPGQMGVPGTDTETGLRLNTLGTIFYVDPNYPGVSDARDGTNPTDPLRTVAAALAKCQAYAGDVVAVMANSNWQYGDRTTSRLVDISEEVTVTVPGVRIVGISPSSALGVYWQPIQNDGVCITVDATDVTIEGFAFWNEDFTGGTGIFAEWTNVSTIPGAVQGENMIVRHCFFGGDLDYGIALDYSWYDYIHDCYFIGMDIAAIHNLATSGDPDYCQVFHNYFVGNALAIDLQGVDGSMIHQNWIIGDPTVANSYINLNGGGGNLVSQNSLVSTLAQYVGGNCNSNVTDGWVQNYCVDGPSVALP